MDDTAIKAGTYKMEVDLDDGTATVTVHVPGDWSARRASQAVMPIAEILSRRKDD